MKKTKEKWQKTFLKIYTGQAISLVTSSVAQYAIIWYIAYKTGSAFWLSMASLVGFLPQGILGLVVGSYIDKRNRKIIMIASDLFIAFVSLVLCIVAIFMELPIWLIMIALALRSIGSAFHSPSLQASIPLIVPEEKMLKYSGYSQSVMSISLIIGPALAAVMYGNIHLSLIILLDVIGAVIAVFTIAISHIPNIKNKVDEKINILKDTKEGFKIIIKNKTVKYLFLIGFFFIVLYMPVGSLFPLMTLSHFGKDTMHAGIVESVFAVGMLLGGVILGMNKIFTKKRSNIILSIFLIGITTFISGLLSSNMFIIFCILTIIMGFAAPIANGTIGTIFAEQIEPEFLGRVYSNYMSLTVVAMPIGLLLSGLFADKIGINLWFAISGFLIILLSIVIKFNKTTYEKEEIKENN